MLRIEDDRQYHGVKISKSPPRRKQQDFLESIFFAHDCVENKYPGLQNSFSALCVSYTISTQSSLSSEKSFNINSLVMNIMASLHVSQFTTICFFLFGTKLHFLSRTNIFIRSACLNI